MIDYLNKLNEHPLYNKCVDIATKLGLRGPFIVPKGTEMFQGIAKRDTISFNTLLEGKWKSGAVMWFELVDEVWKLKSFNFRSDEYATEEKNLLIQNLCKSVLEELNK